MPWINGMQGVGWETEGGVSVKLQLIYRSTLKLQKIWSCYAEPVKMNTAAYQHGPSEGITDLILRHKTLMITPGGQAGMKSKQIVSLPVCINQGASIPFPGECERKTPSDEL